MTLTSKHERCSGRDRPGIMFPSFAECVHLSRLKIVSKEFLANMKCCNFITLCYVPLPERNFIFALSYNFLSDFRRGLYAQNFNKTTPVNK